jgi:hypothetical protein
MYNEGCKLSTSLGIIILMQASRRRICSRYDGKIRFARRALGIEEWDDEV